MAEDTNKTGSTVGWVGNIAGEAITKSPFCRALTTHCHKRCRQNQYVPDILNSLARAVSDYMRSRTHLGLEKDSPTPRPVSAHDRAHRGAARSQRPAPSLQPRRVVPTTVATGVLEVPLARTHATRARFPDSASARVRGVAANSRTRTASRFAPSRELDRPDRRTDLWLATGRRRPYQQSASTTSDRVFGSPCDYARGYNRGKSASRV